MPKMKTRRGAAKRFKIRKSGKVTCNRAYRRHLLEHKSTKVKRKLRGPSEVSAADKKAVRRQLPYG